MEETSRNYEFNYEDRGKVVKAMRSSGFVVNYYGSEEAMVRDMEIRSGPRVGTLDGATIKTFNQLGNPERLNEFLSNLEV